MKVSQLQDILKDLPPDTECLIKDSDTGWDLEIQSITRMDKVVFLGGDYSLMYDGEAYGNYRKLDSLYEMSQEEKNDKLRKF